MIRNVLPDSCGVVVLDMDLRAEPLQANVEAYGHSGPQRTFDLALFGEGGIWLEHGVYRLHVKEIVAKASAGGRLRDAARAS